MRRACKWLFLVIGMSGIEGEAILGELVVNRTSGRGEMTLRGGLGESTTI